MTEKQTDAAQVEPIVILRLCVGVFDSEWFFYATKPIRFLRVPCVGERIALEWLDDESEGYYDTVEAVTWMADGGAVVDCNLMTNIRDEVYGQVIAEACDALRKAGFAIEIPEGVTLLSK